MSEVVISVENLSKQYRLGLVGTGTMTHDLNRFWHKIRGKEDPYLKVGGTNDRANKTNDEYVWALKDINFEVKQGEVLGIIGKNGAGKSTLLKLLSRITSPSTGSIKVHGRIASLLEVGTGFHPELTGRENIFLNGAILGMTKSEIRSKFDEIVDFSGCAKYIDTPVKRYSSGMMVRLGFAVAAHLEPEILVVDEVLAVGDAEFQKKCIGKMKEVSGEGRTVLFVSHNMASIKALCTKSLILENGTRSFLGSVSDGVNKYFDNIPKTLKKGFISLDFDRLNSGEIKFTQVNILNGANKSIDNLFFKSPIKVRLVFHCFTAVKNVVLDLKILSDDGTVIAYVINSSEKETNFDCDVGEHVYEIIINNPLQPGRFSLTVGAHYSNGDTIDYLENIYDFNVLKIGNKGQEDYKRNWIHGYIGLDSKWERVS